MYSLLPFLKQIVESLRGCIRNTNAFGRQVNSRPSLTNRITIGGTKISVIAPLGHQNSGRTKAGRISFKGTHKGRLVKVYSCSTVSQRLFRKRIEAHRFKGISLPELMAVDGIYVVEKWIDGSPATQNPKEALASPVAEFLSDLHESSELRDLSVNHRDGFCYVEFLFDRVKKWEVFDDVREFLNICHKVYVSHRDRIPIAATHPDVTTRNLIRERGSGKLFIIDNELLSVGRGWVLDHQNSLLGGLPDWPTVSIPQQAEELVDSLWTLRQVGSAFDRGDIVSALDLCSSALIRQRHSHRVGTKGKENGRR